MERLPRTPAVFERKTRGRRYEPEDYTLEGKAKYSSVSAASASIKAQFEEEAKEGRMVRMSVDEARRKFGSRLRVAPLAALENNDSTLRVLHDGTNGAAANPNLILRVSVGIRAAPSSDSYSHGATPAPGPPLVWPWT